MGLNYILLWWFIISADWDLSDLQRLKRKNICSASKVRVYFFNFCADGATGVACQGLLNLYFCFEVFYICR